MWLLMSKEKENNFNRGQFLGSAVKLVQDQPLITELIGEDIKIGRVSMKDGWGQMDDYQAKIRVPIIGNKDSGDLFAYARKKEKRDKFKLYKLEMTFGNIKGKKLVLLDLDREEIDSKSAQLADDKKKLPEKKKTNVSYV